MRKGSWAVTILCNVSIHHPWESYATLQIKKPRDKGTTDIPSEEIMLSTILEMLVAEGAIERTCYNYLILKRCCPMGWLPNCRPITKPVGAECPDGHVLGRASATIRHRAAADTDYGRWQLQGARK